MTDRELDALVAKHLFGLDIKKDGAHLSVVYDDGSQGGLSYYSINPIDCSLVKEELRRRGWWYTITYADEYTCRLYLEGCQKRSCLVDKQDTEERAVCLAALKSCGVEV